LLCFSPRDPRTPWHAKAVAGLVAAYALSPIDLIPDFIPIIGYVDDLVIVPAGIWFAIRLVPADLMREFRADAARLIDRPRSRGGMYMVLALWVASAGLLLWWFWPRSAL
jgi:uncharacterized membrane protein YkvA (DUF1232 family)